MEYGRLIGEITAEIRRAIVAQKYIKYACVDVKLTKLLYEGNEYLRFKVYALVNEDLQICELVERGVKLATPIEDKFDNSGVDIFVEIYLQPLTENGLEGAEFPTYAKTIHNELDS